MTKVITNPKLNERYTPLKMRCCDVVFVWL